MVTPPILEQTPMFHLIRKYANRKLYDITTRSFLRQEDILMLVIEGEEVRIEDSDTHIDITNLELQKGFARFPELQKLYLTKRSTRAMEQHPSPAAETAIESLSSPLHGTYIPAEIRLLYKSLEYLSASLRILATEPVYNAALHADLIENFLTIEKRLRKLKKKHKLI